MNENNTESQAEAVDHTPHRAGPFIKTGGRVKRSFGTTAIAIIATAGVVLPMQAPAQAASASHPSSTVSVAASLTAAKTGVPSKQTKHRKQANGTKLQRRVYEDRLHTWANRVRHAHGVRVIAVRPCHEGYAERWTGYLARNNEFFHQDLGRYMDQCKLTKAGEILALGSVTPYRMIQMWMGSPEHRRILLDSSFGLSGIAARRDANGNWIGCIDFGRR